MFWSLIPFWRQSEQGRRLLHDGEAAFIRYNLACYCAQLERLNEARQWLKQAFDIGDAKKLKLMALDDPDLEPLWVDFADT